VLRITQTVKLDNNFSAQYRRNTNSQNEALRLNSNLYTLTDGLSYNLLTNVTGNLQLKTDWYQEESGVNRDYQAFTLTFGLVATF
jgi:hypothetical protein